MTAASPWSVKGIDPKAREIAKDLARRSGMTLGDWLNQMIIEGGEADAPPAPPEPRRPLDDLYREAQARRSAPRLGEDADAARLSRAVETLATRVEAAEQRSVLAISGIDQSVMGVLSRLDEIERDQGDGHRLQASIDEVRTAQTRIADRLKTLENGERAEQLKQIEAALGRMALRLDEESVKAEGARAEAAATDDALKTASEEIGRRLQKVETVMEAAPAAYADAEKVETVLTRMAERLDETQTRTTAAVQSLQASFAGLDARLRAGEARSAGQSSVEMERRFQSLAQELSQRVDASRAELAQRLRAVAGSDTRLDKMESAIRELGGHVAQAEKRSAQAIDRIGREVLRVAHNLGERVATVEHKAADLAEQTHERLAAVETRSTAAVETMSGEVSRLADAMENRLRHADTAQAEALEKLGGEIARIAERLAERISTSDRRSAEAIDEVADKVSKIGVRIDERHTASASELAERIKASEERTAKLLEEARERLDQRLAETRRPAEPAAPPVTAAPLAIAPPSAPITPSVMAAPEPEPLGAPAFAPSNADPFAIPEPPSELHAEPAASSAPAASPVHAGAPVDELDDPFADRDPFQAGASPFNPDDDFAPVGWTRPPGEPHTASLAEPAFAPAAFEEPPPVETAETSPFLGFSVSDFAPAAAAATRPEQQSTREMLDAARQAARRAAGGPPGSVGVPPLEPIGAAPAAKGFGLTFPGRRKKEAAPTLRTVLLASLTAGAITTMGAGAYLMGGSAHEAKAGPEVATMDPPTAAPTAGPATPPLLASAVAPPAAEPASTPTATAVTAAADKTAAATAAKPTTTASAPDAAKPAAAPPATKGSAKSLYAAAVSRLENGDLTGLPDLRAAASQGLPAAQFYLARLYEAGSAGLPKDLGEARRWTEKAAAGGEPSAMYNLASYLYGGDGGAKDPAGAANWFRKAAEHGVVNSQYNLAQLYEKGYGVPQNPAEAYKWYLVAAGSGDTEAKAAAESLKPKLTADAQSAAERSASQLRNGLPSGVKTAAAQP